MITLKDFNDPFDAIAQFEKEIAEFTGAPYCVTTDCCTHALEIVFRLLGTKKVTFPSKTYLSVPMLMHKLGIEYELLDEHWRGEYRFGRTNVWDSARGFKEGMYQEGQIHCVSFGMTKPIDIGRGGCILTDSKELYEAASRMRYDGRDIFAYQGQPWKNQQEFSVGYHYYLRPEECVQGLNKLRNQEFTEQLEKFYNYPDCRDLKIT
jgi:dTDP-4-amino-4,6-dideoxygalactose transaminase